MDRWIWAYSNGLVNLGKLGYLNKKKKEKLIMVKTLYLMGKMHI
jgi:hypothetical protein